MQAQGMRWLSSNRVATAVLGVGLLAAALAMPAAASATNDDHSAHRYYSDEMAHVRGYVAESRQLEPTALMPQDQCRVLEENIAEYNCAVPLAEYASDAARSELLPAPDGVDNLFWEENVWNFVESGATFEGEEDPQSLFPSQDDVEQQGSGAVNF